MKCSTRRSICSWNLSGHDDLHDFAYIFTSSKEGYATKDPEVRTDSIHPLLDMVLSEVPGPEVEPDAPLQMLITTLDWSEYVGRIAVGRIQAGTMAKGQTVELMQADGQVTQSKVASLHTFENLGRIEVPRATAGEIVAVIGLENVEIGDTICELGSRRALPRLSVDEPTLEMVFTINTSPLAGHEGRYVTTRQIRDRLTRELERNVAMRVRMIDGSDAFAVSGRGVLHLSVLIETMRREGYELAVGKPHVIIREQDGLTEEPFESLVVEVPSDRLGPVMELVGERRGRAGGDGRHGDYIHVIFLIPARGLIGLRTRVLNATQGTAIMHHRFARYPPLEAMCRAGPTASGFDRQRPGGGLRLDGLQQRADMFVAPGDEVYEGMIVGENSRDRRHDGQSHQGKEAHQHPRGRQRREHPLEAAAAAVAGGGPGIHRGGRTGRGHADQDPAAKAAAQRIRPPPLRPPRGITGTAVHIFGRLVPRLCLGTHCAAGSAGRWRGGASRPVGYEAEPRNQGVSRNRTPRSRTRP